MGKKEENNGSSSGGSADIESMRRDIDEQSRQVKELSNAMISIVQKIKKDRADGSAGIPDDSAKRLDMIEKRLEMLENSFEKGCCTKDAMPPKKEEKKEVKIEPPKKEMKVEMPKKEEPAKAEPVKMEAEKAEIKEAKVSLPPLPASMAGSVEKKNEGPHVIETTIEEKKETQAPFDGMLDVQKTQKAEEKKGGMFSGIMKKIFKHDTGEKLLDNPKLPQAPKAMTLKEIGAQAKVEPKPLPPVDKICQVNPDTKMLPAPEKMAEVKTAPAPVTEAKKPSVFEKKVPVLLPVKKDEPKKDAEPAKTDVASEIEKELAKANELVDNQRYSEATDIYLKLVDAYESNKDYDSVRKYGEKIDKLYERISARLLSSLMTSSPEKKK